MRIPKIVKPLLISAAIIGGLSLTSSWVNASKVHPRQIRVSLISHKSINRQLALRHANHNVNPNKNRHQIRKSHYVKAVKKPRIKKSNQARKVRSFKTVNNRTHDYLNKGWEAVSNGRRETVKSTSGPRVTFKTLRFLPNNVSGTHFVQSINVTPNGHYAYLGCDALPYLSGYTKIIRVNLRRRRGGIIVGPRFYGGHGQALSYNPRNNQLWLLVDPSGPLNHGTFDLISNRTLKPVKHIGFNLHSNDLGDTLAFDNKGNAYNENRIWSWDATPKYQQGNVILYKGKINSHYAKLNQVSQGIRRAPGYIIQALAYNHRTKRLYIETDDAIMSVPVNKLGRLSPRNVKETRIRGRREYEGLSFDRSGRAYIVMARPNEILKSTRIY